MTQVDPAFYAAGVVLAGPAADGSNGQFLRTNGTGVTSWASAGAGDALTTNPLSQFAATTSAQLAGVISDETGSGALVFANAPAIVSPTITPTSAAAIVALIKGATSQSANLTEWQDVSSNVLLSVNPPSSNGDPLLKYRVASDGFFIQPLTANSDGYVNFAPSGSAIQSAIYLHSTSVITSLSNTKTFAFGGGFSGSLTTDWTFGSTVFGNATGSGRPIVFVVGSSIGRVERMRLGLADLVINETGADIDFRVEGDTDANLIFVDASADMVCIGSATPAGKLTIQSPASHSMPPLVIREISSTPAEREQFAIDTAWIDSTDATRKARVTLNAYDTATREFARGWADGSKGRFAITTPASAPTDAHLAASQISFYLDESGHNLIVRVKYADGTTLKTATFALV